MNRPVFSLSGIILLGLAVTACSQSRPDVSSASKAVKSAVDGGGVHFVARGNEPFWTIKTSQSTLTWITPEHLQGKQLNVDQVIANGDVKYSGVDGDKAFTLIITPAPCTDTMSGETFGHTSVWTYAGESNTGCATGGN
ncbi:Uncharacterized membrane protein [Pseudomonas taetrolens]|uniref:Uncharacterized membrane protein n=1 Tax=Pseudomonas taetrolens TaxID=47884 RepID=A0A1H4SR48_PSETA|nr:hypothetical protein [Pseudomonas taetrolens]SEC46653.1 Uncharacterized membrane protein [Pseudomonas taetrolens]SQF86620.1 lipoprotein [Pseudomonas taetrolens]VEH49696.1 lipoprotein [Pseudomonas taetrolens]